MIHHLNNIGWVASNGMGISSISFSEIQAYNDLTNACLSPDEVMVLKRMSSAYCTHLQDKNPNSKAPYKHSLPD